MCSPFEETQKVCYTGKNIPKKEFLCKRGKKHEKGIVCGLLYPQRGFPLQGAGGVFYQKLEETGAYEIERLCLMDENLSYFSDGFFFQREALLAEGKFDHPRFRYAHRFAAADKIVIAAPFWDLSFPALLKVYIENLAWMVLPFIR